MDTNPRITGFYTFGQYQLDPVGRTLMRGGAPVELTPRLFDTLLYLLENRTRVVERDELERAVWGRRRMEGANLAMAISALRKSLQGDAEVQNLIATVPGRGYQFVADVSCEARLSVQHEFGIIPPQPDADPEVANFAWGRRLPVRHIAALVALILLSCGAIAAWVTTLPIKTAAPPLAFVPPPRSVAVLPFTNLSGDPAQAYFSDGLSEELIDALSQVSGLQVAARSSAFSVKRTDASVPQIARRLNVSAVVTGSVRHNGGRLGVDAALLDGATGAELWSHHYDSESADVLKVQGELAEAVTSALRVQLSGGETAGLTLGGTENPSALDAYLRAMAAMRHHNSTEADYQRQIALFDSAVALDPGFAIAQAERSCALWSIAARTSSNDRAFIRGLKDAALAGAQRAVSLAPDLAIAHVALGYALGAYRPDFRRQEVEFERARELAPGSAEIAREYGRFEGFAGHPQRALQAAQQAVALDPLKPAAYVRLAWALYYARRPDDALATLRHARDFGIRETPDLAEFAGRIALMQGKPEAARLACHDDTDWETNECLAIAFHALGKPQEAAAEVAKLDSLGADSGPYSYVVIYAQWGRPGDALTWLEKAYDLPDLGITQIEADPLLDPLRALPRFKAIERKLDVPP